MAKIYIDNHDGTYTVENPVTCCQHTTKAELSQAIVKVTSDIALLTARKAELEADLVAINAL